MPPTDRLPVSCPTPSRLRLGRLNHPRPTGIDLGQAPRLYRRAAPVAVDAAWRNAPGPESGPARARRGRRWRSGHRRRASRHRLERRFDLGVTQDLVGGGPEQFDVRRRARVPVLDRQRGGRPMRLTLRSLPRPPLGVALPLPPFTVWLPAGAEAAVDRGETPPRVPGKFPGAAMVSRRRFSRYPGWRGTLRSCRGS